MNTMHFINYSSCLVIIILLNNITPPSVSFLGIIHGVMNTLGTVPGFLAPQVVGWLTTTNVSSLDYSLSAQSAVARSFISSLHCNESSRCLS